MLTVSLLVLLTASILLWILRIMRACDTLMNVPRLSITPKGLGELPTLTIVIPARNEEKNLPACLKSIESQLNERINCLVINDRSTDQTESFLKAEGYIEIHTPPLSRKNYLNLDRPPQPGWTGKNNALHAGITYLSSDWLLFTDADTLHIADGIQSALAYALKNQLSFLTLTPRCLTASLSEYLIQPSAMAMMGLWYPLSKVNQPKSSEHFANGQFLMITRKLYQELGGHAAVADCFLEDFALMKKAKNVGAKAGCFQGQEIYGTRMYQSLKQIWQGWRRIYLHAAGSSSLILLRHFAELCIASLLPNAAILILIFAPHETGFLPLITVYLAGLWVFIAAATALATYQTLGAPRRYALLHPLAAILVAGILLDAVRVSFLHLETKWRG